MTTASVGALAEHQTEPRAQKRNSRGRYSTARDPSVLFEIVPEVARAAAQFDRDPFKDPATVSQRAWNAARRTRESLFGAIPQANEICRQLSDRQGKPFPWPELLALVFDPNRNPKKTYEQRLSEPDRLITSRDVFYALNRVAFSLGTPPQLKHQYEEERQRLLDEAKQHGRYHALKLRLPTVGQIENACGKNWDRALEVAGLQPRPTASSPPTPATRSREATGRLPVLEALVLFYQGHGYLPAEPDFSAAAERQGISIDRGQTQGWFAELEAARQVIVARGLGEPPPYGKRIRGEDAIEKPGLFQTRYTHTDVVKAVREFVESQPPNTPATNKRWRAHQRGRDGVPSLNVLIRHGGLKELLVEASHPDWRARAEEWNVRVPQPKSAGRKGRPESVKRDLVLEVLHARAQATAAEIADELKLSGDNVRYYLRELRKAGAIELTKVPDRPKVHVYRLIPRRLDHLS